MITATLIMLLARTGIMPPLWAERLNSILRSIGKKAVSLFIGFLVLNSIFSQEQTLVYKILRKGDVVGNIQFTQQSYGNRISMKLESEVKTRFILPFIAKGNEEAVYDNGIMTWSSIYRKMNGKVKADKKIKAHGNNYIIYNGSKTETLNNYPIRYNMLSIYSNEPVNISKVYSDNFQQFLDIQKINERHYKIRFPDGNYNEYYYEGGICAKVNIHHSLYSAVIELKKQ